MCVILEAYPFLSTSCLRSVGMPRLERVELSNPPSSSHVIHLNSISGDSPVFHASFFKSKVVKPGESTTFDVVFLARTAGAVHNTLYIHTSLGTFDYRVSVRLVGIGTMRYVINNIVCW